MSYLLILIIGMLAGVLSGVIGTGSTIILLPILVWQYGPQEAVPIMAVAALMSNVAKALSWWRDIDWRAFVAWSLPGIPAAAYGAHTLLVLPPRLVDGVLGLFFLVMIPGRRWLLTRKISLALWQFAVIGAVVGFLTGILLSTGPLSVPAFTAYGLVKGAFLATEAASSLALTISKVVTFQQLGALPWPAVNRGLIIGASVMAGSFLAKTIVHRISTHAFHYLMDVVMLCAGLSMVWAACA